MHTINKKPSLDRETRDPQIFDNRSKSALEYAFKLIMNISMGAIALSFIAIIRKIEPVLTQNQQLLLITIIGLFSTVVASGFLYAYIHYEKNHRRSLVLREGIDRYIKDYEDKRGLLHKARIYSVRISVLAFIFGLLTTIVFMVIRIKGI